MKTRNDEEIVVYPNLGNSKTDKADITKTNLKTGEMFLKNHKQTLSRIVVGLGILVIVSSAVFATVYKKKEAENSNNTEDAKLSTAVVPSPTPEPAEPTSKPSPISTRSPKSLVTPNPTPTNVPLPTPANDIEVTYLYIIDKYHNPNNSTTYTSSGEPDVQTFEETLSNNSFYVSETIKNNGPNDLQNIKRQLWINGYLYGENTLESLKAYETKNINEFYLPSDPGDYSVEIRINPYYSVTENNYSNNTMNKKYVVIPDKTPPNIISLSAYRDSVNKQTCLGFSFNDNVSTPQMMKYYEKLDSEEFHEITWDHSIETGYKRCLIGQAGENHTYTVKITDNRGNTAEKGIDFQLYSF